MFPFLAWAALSLPVVVGGMALLGWIFGLSALLTVFPGATPLSPLSALTFVLAGVTVGLAQWKTDLRWQGLLFRTCAGAVLLLGLVALGTPRFGWDLSASLPRFPEGLGVLGALAPRRTAIWMPLNFALLGLALVFYSGASPRSQRASQVLVVTVALISLFALLEDTFGNRLTNTPLVRLPVSLSRAVLFLVLASGIINGQRGLGLLPTVLSDGAGGRTARLLLPAAVGAPVGIGILIAWLERAGRLSPGEHGAVFVTVLVFAFSSLIWLNARQIDRREREGEEALHTRLRLATLVESSGEAIISSTLDGIITSWNAAAERLYGFTTPEALGQAVSLIVPDDRQAELARIFEQVRSGRRVAAFETQRRRKDDGLIQIEVNVSPIVDPAGRVLGAAGIARDVTERQRAEEEIRRLNAELEQRVLQRTAQLEAANKEMEAFSYSVSHDLRAPLRAIDGFAHVLTEDYRERLDAEGQRVLGVIASETRRMGDLIDALLTLSRLGRQEMKRVALDMTGLARTVFQELAAANPQRNAQLDLKALLPVAGDPILLRQVWVNLLSNALKYTGARDLAVIEVGSRVEKEQTTYYVKDNGAGFDMRFIAKLFGVFQRLHRNDEFPGTGVGLALVQRIIHRHGGRVWAEGKVNEGATFYFSLPNQPSQA